jgi:2,4-dienoyl-CoA reductase-like NADH-dependent reductase (Old Yellow Enzyme family)
MQRVLNLFGYLLYSGEMATPQADAPLLFRPLPIRQITLPNRIAVSPMCEYSCVDGFANDWHLVHLGSRAVGGAGLVMAEATAVTPEGRITPGDLGIWRDEHIEPLARITKFVERQGAVPGIQLAHAGRKGSCQTPWDGGTAIAPSAEDGWQVCAPSPVPFLPGDPIPHELTAAEILEVIAAFFTAAVRAVDAGFQVVEIHAAHGYLLHEFFSPLSNFRQDDYGGSFDNRIRLTLDVVKAVRQAIGPHLPLFLRISSTDWTDGGWTVDDSVELARRVKSLGVDLIDVSSGGNVAEAKIPVEPSYQVPMCQRIRGEAQIMAGAVGMITAAQQAEEILQSGQADLILMAREFLRDPYFPMRAAHTFGVPVSLPKQYLRAYPNSVTRPG